MSDFTTTFENEHRDNGRYGLAATGRVRVIFESGWVDSARIPECLREAAQHFLTTADDIAFGRARDEERDLALRAGQPNQLPPPR